MFITRSPQALVLSILPPESTLSPPPQKKSVLDGEVILSAIFSVLQVYLRLRGRVVCNKVKFHKGEAKPFAPTQGLLPRKDSRVR